MTGRERFMRRTGDRQARSQRIERRISAVSSIAMCVLTVLVQIVVTLLLTRLLKQHASLAYAFLELIGVVMAMSVFLRSGSPSYKLSWLCLLLVLPVSGMLLFLLWGGTHQAKTLSLKKVPPPAEREGARRQSENNVAKLTRKDPAMGRVAAYLQKRDFLLYNRTSAKYFGDGMEFFDDLIGHIQQAETYIFLEYFIIAEGKIWDRILEALRERAAAGVEIHIIFDDFGNLTRFSDDMIQSIQDAGIEIRDFNPVHRYVNRIYFNYRDHRKIAVIDGYWAYTGGINLADEYGNIFERFGRWKDSAVRIEGDGAWALAAQFIQMWEMMYGTLPNEDDYYRPRTEGPEVPGFCQAFTDGPLNNPDNPMEDTFFQLISAATRFLYITTPYYAVEESMQQALCIAADSGVDVRLMMPAIPDKKYAYIVAETYWGELLRHGVKIYKYTPGFIHAKSVLVDRKMALVGSPNMDYRSFQLHFESAALLYDMPAVEELLEDMDAVMKESTLYTMEDWKKRSWLRRTFASLLKLAAIWF
ncbi:MAG: cardiolipin synthase [Oscillibacter ruminantium]|nr:cardiolipin synthase [Oscillibacter ruminantium]MEA5042857.1 cardiolipin synthase [Oscillibacter ruminantium]